MRALFFCLVLVGFSIFLSGCSALEKNSKAGLQIITSDVPSTVFLSGQYLEKTPLIEKNIKPGEYTIRIQPDNSEYIPHELHVTLRKGLLTVVTWKPGKRPETSGGVVYEMEPLKNKKDTEVSFITIPDGAIINVTGRDKTFSPATIKDIAAGHTEFEVVLPSYETQKHTLNVVEGYRMIINVKLAKLDNVAKQDNQALPIPAPSDSPNVAGSIATSSGTPAASSSAQTIKPGVTILSTGYFRDGKEVLRVRETASSAGKEVGFASVGQTYPYLGQTEAGWHFISLPTNPDNSPLSNASETVIKGWVSADYAKLVQ